MRRKGEPWRDAVPLFFLGSFPYAGMEPCRVRGCKSPASHFVAFRHVRLSVFVLCSGHAAQAEAVEMDAAFRSFDRPLVDGEGRHPQNHVHALRGAVHG